MKTLTESFFLDVSRLFEHICGNPFFDRWSVNIQLAVHNPWLYGYAVFSDQKDGKRIGRKKPKDISTWCACFSAFKNSSWRILTWSPCTIGRFTVNLSPLQLDDKIFAYNVMHVKLKMMVLSYHFADWIWRRDCVKVFILFSEISD